MPPMSAGGGRPERRGPVRVRARGAAVGAVLLLATLTPAVLSTPAATAQAAVGTFSAASNLTTARTGHTATLLAGPECQDADAPDYCGKMLVVGGSDANGALATTELYDPASRTWELHAPLITARTGHTATQLADGRVLVVGGTGADGTPLDTAQIYEPRSARALPGGGTARGAWSGASRLSAPRTGHTATLLPDGRVLVVGGRDPSGVPVTATETYDPGGLDASAPWRTIAPLATARADHTATLLASGEVLVAGGTGAGGDLVSAERFDPASGSWQAAPDLPAPESGHTATALDDGRVLVAGSSAALFDPGASGGAGAWSAPAGPADARAAHTATLLGDGRVLVTGGQGASGALASSEVYDAATGTWSTTGALIAARQDHTATRLGDGIVLVVGGTAESAPLASAEVFDPTATTQPPSVTQVSPSGGPVAGGTAVTIRGAALGGATQVRFGDRAGSSLQVVSATELRVNAPPSDGPETVTVTVTTPAGTSFPVAHAAFRYAPPPTVTAINPDTGPASGGTQVVITGTTFDFPDTAVRFGETPAQAIVSRTDTELVVVSPPHDPVTVGITVVTPGGTSETTFADQFTYGDGTWVPAGSMAEPRYHHTATVLADGRVLVTGGTQDFSNRGTALASVEIFDPSTGQWTAAAPLHQARYEHTATLLDGPSCRSAARAEWCGNVLVAGGQHQRPPQDYVALASAELYDPMTDSWAVVGMMNETRFSHTATLLAGPACRESTPPAHCGKVLVAGGSFDEIANRAPRQSSEVYDPATGTWSLTGPLDPGCEPPSCGRSGHTATPLPDGRVLVAGGLAANPLAAPAGTEISNQGTINGVASNSITNFVMPPQAVTDPYIVLTSDPPAGSPVAPGDRIAYTIRYFNLGTETITDAEITFSADTATRVISTSGGAELGDGTPGAIVAFPSLTIAAGTSVAEPAGTLEVVVELRVDTAEGKTVEATAAYRPTERYDASGAVATHTVVESSLPRVAVASSPASGSTVKPGDTITYTLAVFNPRSSAASDVVVSDRLTSRAVDFVSVSEGGTYDHIARTVTFAPATVAAGTTAEAPAFTHTITVRVREEDAEGGFIPDGSVIGNHATANQEPSNRVTHAMLRTKPTAATVRVAMTADPIPGGTVKPGDRITYTVGYFNAGSAVASGVTVSVTPDRETSFVSASPADSFTVGEDGSIHFPGLHVPPGTTAADPAGIIQVTVEADDDGAGLVRASARVESGGESAVEHTLVSPDAWLVLSSTPVDGALVRPDDEITYTLTYFNIGMADIPGAVVTSSMGAELRFLSASQGASHDAVTDVVTFPPVTLRPRTTVHDPAGTFALTAAVRSLTEATASAEIYDPAAGTWAPTANLGAARFGHTATRLDVEPCGEVCGWVLVVGGVDRFADNQPGLVGSSELFNATTGSWSPAGVLREERAYHSGVALPDGTVVVAGGSFGFPGSGPITPASSAEIFSPLVRSWRDTGSLEAPRGMHAAVALPEGDVLVTGGGTVGSQGPGTGPPALASTERYQLPVLPPAVTALDANTGPSTGGTTVTISGSGFEDLTAVRFGDAEATGVEVHSRTELRAVSPPHPAGGVDVVVQTAGGSSVPVPAGQFTYAVSRPPGPVTDLTAASTGAEGEIRLSFSAPPTDATFPPPATRYVVKQAAEGITDGATFTAAPTLCGGECVFAPVAVGDVLSLTVADLAPGTTYHYALRAVNEIGAGPLSNAASAQTAGVAPVGPAASTPPAPSSGGAGGATGSTRPVPVTPTDLVVSSPQTPPPVVSEIREPQLADDAPTASTVAPPRGQAGGPTAAEGDDSGFPWGMLLGIWVPVMAGLGWLGWYLNRRFRSRPPVATGAAGMRLFGDDLGHRDPPPETAGPRRKRGPHRAHLRSRR